VNRVIMCEVKYKENAMNNKQIKKNVMVSNEKKWIVMNPI
jgi:hypothetical protein